MSTNSYSLNQIVLFDAQSCQKFVDSIHSLRINWTPRGGADIPFFTLGAASYLDGRDYKQYLKLAQQMNPILLACFRDLYLLLAKAIEKETNETVKFEERIALPGFHIFQYHPFFETQSGAVHFDLQYKEIPWEYKTIDYDHPFSFTLPLSLPEAGGGLNFWDLEYDLLKNKSHQEIEQIRHQTTKQFLPYKVGHLVIQKGLFLHQIAPSNTLKHHDERITLQGHGLICDGVLRLYW